MKISRDSMHATTQTIIASVLAALTLQVFAVFVYLVFFFPRLAAIWAGMGQPLSMAERAVCNVSLFCRVYGLLLLPVLMGMLIASVLWVIIAARYASTKT